MEAVNIHATCVVLRGAGSIFGAPPDCGVLLIGESGSGKSDLALRLIAAGAQLVADDRAELFVQDGMLHARSPEMLAGLIEVRGVGILSLPFEPAAMIGLAVLLAPRERMARMPDFEAYDPPSGLVVHKKPPLIRLPSFDHSTPAKIAAAAAAFANPLFTAENKPI